MRLLVWLLRAFVFFALFAFALNNQQSVTLNWFFGYAWTARLVIIVLAAFAAGVVIGVLAMMPSWWRQRRRAHRTRPDPSGAPATAAATSAPAPVAGDGTEAHGV
jgi:lipopolysaccharide assembly protein A